MCVIFNFLKKWYFFLVISLFFVFFIELNGVIWRFCFFRSLVCIFFVYLKIKLDWESCIEIIGIVDENNLNFVL